jgi:dipeptidyl-peptidase III
MKDFQYQTEQFADIRILRYSVPNFDALSLKQKKLSYFLYQAALCGRDILWDQNYKYNLLIRKTLETIIRFYPGDINENNFQKFIEYTKRVWFSNGIHHHNSTEKILPDFNKKFFKELIEKTPADFPMEKQALIAFLTPILFDASIDAKRVELNPEKDIIADSANNFYENLSHAEVEDFYSKKRNPDDDEPISYGMNSKLIKENGEIKEIIWKKGGMYSAAIEKILYWLNKAIKVAETKLQEQALKKLASYYESGDLKKFDEYSILWVQDTKCEIDVINGFIETYGDSAGMRATYESVVQLIDKEATKRAKAISENALWFEQHSPTDKAYKKEEVKGVSARAVHVIVQAGDCAPSGPIGINLPNADWIRGKYGSKSVTISNIMQAYEEASKESGALEEFAYSEEEIALSKKYGLLATNLHVDLHEIVGHGSGKLKEGVAEPSYTLKNYASTIEEARADLFALFYARHPKLVELGLMPNTDVGKTEYNGYIRGGLLTQLVRVELGKDLEESHMRNRQLIAKWAYDLGKDNAVIERKQKNNKSYFVINDYEALNKIFGEMLKEIQRIKSEGDYQAAKNLIEKYAVKIDYDIHKEVLERWKKLNIPPYSGFIQPELEPIIENNKIIDVIINYPQDFSKQMLDYADNYGLL